ncbi:hypothetical protein F4553_004291 [Allocatelliglobosispora scoriae]|uniref:Uncharacterized protein n=1 Tax=Allocatelliglobosispora scoriae TaxID=643052 RepID=A0A841BVX0_9ACTN|nr:hypothetical protein [Allocatelliglobosispora scoriae]MBB5870912.1 hypothetical protein [Allocatelliglobosispora scoriae]
MPDSVFPGGEDPPTPEIPAPTPPPEDEEEAADPREAYLPNVVGPRIRNALGGGQGLGSSRRYGMIVALLVGLASLPTWIVLRAGVDEILPAQRLQSEAVLVQPLPELPLVVGVPRDRAKQRQVTVDELPQQPVPVEPAAPLPAQPLPGTPQAPQPPNQLERGNWQGKPHPVAKHKKPRKVVKHKKKVKKKAPKPKPPVVTPPPPSRPPVIHRPNRPRPCGHDHYQPSRRYSGHSFQRSAQIKKLNDHLRRLAAKRYPYIPRTQR